MNMAIAMNVIYAEEAKREEAIERGNVNLENDTLLDVSRLEVLKEIGHFSKFLTMLFGLKPAAPQQ